MLRNRHKVEKWLPSLYKFYQLEMLDIETTVWPKWTPDIRGPSLEKLVFLRIVGAAQLPKAFTSCSGLPRLVALGLVGLGAGSMLPPLQVILQLSICKFSHNRGTQRCSLVCSHNLLACK
jgi:hypothetical protein